VHLPIGPEVEALPRGCRVSEGVVESRLETPRAAGVAGLAFSALFVAAVLLLRTRPASGASAAEIADFYLEHEQGKVALVGLYVIPFAGIAFLWFMGVLRNRVGAMEDQFFATIFLGSGLLFVAMLFSTAATAGGLLQTIAANSGRLPDQNTFAASRATSYVLLNVFGIKMAGVFLFSTCTIGLRTTVIPRWVALLGYVCAVVLLLIITDWEWIALLFPLWILLVSAYILVAEFRQGRGEAADDPAGKPSQREAPTP